ncbi:HipA N-terminal domain-containing protein [Flavobacterium turcicum]|uniref:HipA N-terminal domain-containing protein n=1 Tax=Flavobacterium turcicum TaxID=2764718 RepID=A0ABR7JEH0_9FLAO|nr:HipA N-terminal domain-containing protein [Flavobacterium turcicum]MBC5862852.1 HipA N-terminal domain-containing protein [Flavobacterium turcicum]NHL01584.1 phosphatidylinositol kinase [Flavobacterium turcicum]
MRNAVILFKDQEAGLLTQHDDASFSFRYYVSWITDSSKQAISLTLPKSEQEFYSKFLFPFFYNMLPEGSNKLTVCKYNRIDLDDYFGLLMITAKEDSIGAVRVIKIEK